VVFPVADRRSMRGSSFQGLFDYAAENFRADQKLGYAGNTGLAGVWLGTCLSGHRRLYPDINLWSNVCFIVYKNQDSLAVSNRPLCSGFCGSFL